MQLLTYTRIRRKPLRPHKSTSIINVKELRFLKILSYNISTNEEKSTFRTVSIVNIEIFTSQIFSVKKQALLFSFYRVF